MNATALSSSIESIRAQFPVLAQYEVENRPIHYLDSAATALKPQAVVDAVTRYYCCFPANVHRALHWLSEEATDAYEGARDKAAALLHAENRAEIIFTRGTTEGINLIAHSWLPENCQAGDVILLSEVEHHSNMIPWQLAAQRLGLELRYIPALSDGQLDMAEAERLLDHRVKLLALHHISNVTGLRAPLEGLIQKARGYGAAICIDAAQSVPHISVDVQQLNCDFLAFSGHKLYGPTGTGVLYVRASQQNRMRPFLGGGDMINTVKLEGATWADPPHKFEAGTPNIAGVIGLGAAIDFVQGIGYETLLEHDHAMTTNLEKQLNTVPGLTIIAPGLPHYGVVSFVLDGIHPHDVAQFANEQAVAIRAGNLCAQPMVHRLGYPSICRASTAVYTTPNDVDALIDALIQVERFFHGA